jgi:DNA-directed RNA polymerase specialized sigma24 family protein
MNRKREQIIVEFYNDPDINAAIGKMNPPDLRDDLKSEMFVVICEMSDEKFFDLHEKKILKWFLVRTMLNMIKSDRSTFAKKFRQIFIELSSGFNEKPDETKENEEKQIEKISKALAGLHWYERELFKLYSKHRNISLLSRETGIPYRSISKTIFDVKRKIKSKMKVEKESEKWIVFTKCEIGFHFEAGTPPVKIADQLEAFRELVKQRAINLEHGSAKLTSIGDFKISKILP